MLYKRLQPMPAAELSAEGTPRVLTLSGELDIAVMAALSELIANAAAAGPERLVFDLEQVTFMDCAGIRAILAARRLLPDGQRPVLRNASPAVRRLLKLAGLEAQFATDFPSSASAITGP